MGNNNMQFPHEQYFHMRIPTIMLRNRGPSIKAKKGLYEGVIVPTALYGAEAWGKRSAERRKVNVIEMKCLGSLVGVSRI